MPRVMRTRMARGVDGFRLDSVGFIGKDPRFPDALRGDRARAGRGMAHFLNTLEGTPSIDQGQEIGMTNGQVTHTEEVDDIEARNDYATRVAAGDPAPQVMRQIAARHRDNVPTVMQWDDSPCAGFSGHAPWIRVNNNHASVNVAQARRDPGSIFVYHQEPIRKRRAHDVWATGVFEDLAPEHSHVCVYSRTLGAKKILVALTFSGKTLELPQGAMDVLGPLPGLMLANYPQDHVHHVHHVHHAPTPLSPWEAWVWGKGHAISP